MGIRGLYKFIKQHAPAAVMSMPAADLAGKIVAIDVSILVYQFCAVGKANGIVNARGKYINHVQGVFFFISRLLALGAKPLCVFDGPPPAEKAGVLSARQAAREMGGNGLPPGVFDEVRKLLMLMGVPYMDAPGEAEAQAASLCSRGLAELVLSEDMDVLAFGGAQMIKGYSTSAPNVTVVDADAVLAGLGLARDEFVDFCILCGCDYAGTIPGIGPQKAYKYISAYKSIEAVITHKVGAANVPDDFDYVRARELLHAPVVSQQTASEIRTLSRAKHGNSRPALADFLVSRHGLQAGRVTTTLNRLSKAGVLTSA